MKRHRVPMGTIAATGLVVAGVVATFVSFGVPNGCGGSPATDELTQGVREPGRREPGQDEWTYPGLPPAPKDGSGGAPPADGSGPTFGWCDDGSPSNPGQEILQCFADLVTGKPIRCIGSALCNTLEGRQQSPSVSVCTEPLVNQGAPVLVPGRHVFACVDGPTETPLGCEGLAHQCPPGERVCLDDLGNPCEDSWFRLCTERRPRPGQQCGNVYMPPDADPGQFAAEMCCMMQELSRWGGNYDFMSGNCGSTANLLVQCAGGAMSDPGAANLGIGCGFEDRQFQPPANPDGTSPPMVPGTELCKRLKEACTCKSRQKVH